MFKFTLRATRISCGYTEDEVARHCGVSTKVIDEVELDSGEILYSLLLKMTDLYNIAPDHVYLGLESDCRHKLSLG